MTMIGGTYMAAALAAAAAEAPPPQIALRAEVHASGDAVLLGEVAVLDALPETLRGLAAAIVVLRFRPGQKRIEVEGRAIAERARAAVPALARWPINAEARVSVIAAPAPAREATAAAPRCMRTLAAIDAGAVPVRSELADAECPADRDTAFAWDARARTVRATRDVAEGEVVRAVPTALLADVRPGADLVLSATVGPVTVRRTVSAVQPGRSGERLFVRTADGKVVEMRLPEENGQ